ncbi:Hypothetical_protein [Hexamita inflata]|uniref:Hypothetical_protein n=1 Tax=Hexamita inflata TaxID=28002 RepID=A0AA86NBB8_9EUKA|nr:Hypothetical protein HINF_LOCUS4179 [Hexamita inflata]
MFQINQRHIVISLNFNDNSETALMKLVQDIDFDSSPRQTQTFTVSLSATEQPSNISLKERRLLNAVKIKCQQQIRDQFKTLVRWYKFLRIISSQYDNYRLHSSVTNYQSIIQLRFQNALRQRANRPPECSRGTGEVLIHLVLQQF